MLAALGLSRTPSSANGKGSNSSVDKLAPAEAQQGQQKQRQRAQQAQEQQQQQQHDALVARLRRELGPDVDAQLRQGGEEGLTDQTLRRWLVARKWVYEDAKKDLAAHAEWRVHYMPPGGRLTEADPMIQENLVENKTFLQGLDSLGHPILLGWGANHIPKTLESTSRWVCYVLDAMDYMGRLVPNWDGKGTGIIYLTGMTMKNGDLNAGRALFTTLQTHYPERMYRLFLYDAPALFHVLWKLCQPFLDPVTARKIVFVYPKETTEGNKELARLVAPELLPPEMGGTGRCIPLSEAWQMVLQGSLEGFSKPRTTPPKPSPATAAKRTSAAIGVEEQRVLQAVAVNGGTGVQEAPLKPLTEEVGLGGETIRDSAASVQSRPKAI